jgi:carboxymethylenebutenolidase
MQYELPGLPSFHADNEPREGALMEPEKLAHLWDNHNAAEFISKDADAALESMVEDPYVTILANGGGGQGKEQVRAFYADVLIPQWPDDAQMQPVNRVLGQDQLVDELHLSFTHAKQMDWLLPGAPASNRTVEMDIAIVVQFRNDLIAGERLYWDQAAVLRQVGLLKA